MATYRKRNGRWQAQVRKMGAPAVSRTFDTLAAAKKWAVGVERAIDSGEWTGEQASGTLGDLIRRHREEAATGPRPMGESKAAVLSKLERELGSLRLRELTTERVLAYARLRQKEGAGPVTVGIDLSYLGTILRRARALWRLPVTAQPVSEAREALRMTGGIAKSRSRERRPKPEELSAILAHLRARPHSHVPVADIALFAVATAMRLGEICRLRWADLDAGRRTVVIRDRKDPRNKAGRNETIPLLTVTRLDPLAMILAREKRGELIWPYEPDSVSAAWTRACKALGIEDLHFHDLRAEAASRMLEAGMAIEQVALVTGHKDWAMLRRYARLRGADLVSRFALDLPANPEEPPPDSTSPDPT